MTETAATALVDPAAPAHISVKVVDQNQNEVFFKVKPTTPFKKMFNAACDRIGKNPGSVRFFFEGAQIYGEQTPGELEMEDQDSIEMFQEQIGGDKGSN